MQLHAIRLENFKGIRQFDLRPDGRSIAVRGTNAAGKTTLADAWHWLWTGRDSSGSTEFSLKTLGTDGQPIPAIDHTVEAEIEHDGQRHTLYRTYREAWTRRRGSTESEMTGHETSYRIDGAPIREREWQQRTGDLVPASLWSLLSSPYAFAALPWAERRRILVQLCGDVTPADVCASDPELSWIAGKPPAQARQEANGQIAAARRDLQQIPARIDELTRQLDSLRGLDRAALQREAEHLLAQLAAARDGDPAAPLRQERSAALLRRQELTAEMSQAIERESAALRLDLHRLQDQAEQTADAARRADATATREQRAAEEAASERKRLLEDYRRVAARPGTCPMCGASPEHHDPAVVQRRLDDQQQQLRAIQTRGKTAADQVSASSAAAEQARATAREQRDRETLLREQVTGLQATLAAIRNTPRPQQTEIYRLSARVLELDSQISSGSPVDTAQLQRRSREISSEISRLDGAQATQARIAELHQELRQASDSQAEAERLLGMLDRFHERQAELLEARVNRLFRQVTFRLWRRQINGGLEQRCDVLVDGVPFGAGLNHGAEVNAGLDIVRTLSGHYGITLPVWIDGAESVVQLDTAGLQVIRLVVDAECPGLEVRNE